MGRTSSIRKLAKIVLQADSCRMDGSRELASFASDDILELLAGSFEVAHFERYWLAISGCSSAGGFKTYAAEIGQNLWKMNHELLCGV